MISSYSSVRLVTVDSRKNCKLKVREVFQAKVSIHVSFYGESISSN